MKQSLVWRLTLFKLVFSVISLIPLEVRNPDFAVYEQKSADQTELQRSLLFLCYSLSLKCNEIYNY